MIEPEMECPYCDGTAHIKKRGKDVVYRGELFYVIECYFVCDKCLQDFTTTESDTITMKPIFNRYKERQEAIKMQKENNTKPEKKLIDMTIKEIGEFLKGKELFPEAIARVKKFFKKK